MIRLTLNKAIQLAAQQSVDATMALNELRTAYWEYRTHRADQLPEIILTGTLPQYTNTYSKTLLADGDYTNVHSNWLGLSSMLSIGQNIPLTGGRISLSTSLDFTRQLSGSKRNEYVSIPVGITLSQPIFAINKQKWERRIEPIRYKEAKAAYIESVEEVTLNTIIHYFNLLYEKENYNVALQNQENADKLYQIAIAKRKIGHISENELMQLQLSALQAKGLVTEAESSVNKRMFQLRAFLGFSENDIIDPVTPGTTSTITINYNEALQKALENNAFAKNIRRRQLEAEYQVAAAKGERRSIQLDISLGYTGKDIALRHAYQHLRSNQLIEISLSIPLLDWGKRRGKVKVAESNREVIMAKVKQEELAFSQEIYLVVENYNNQARQLHIAQQADAIAAKRYTTTIETFMVGKIDILDLNDARRAKDDARLKYINELYKYWSYYYNIRSLTLYDYHTDSNLDVEFEEIIKR